MINLRNLTGAQAHKWQRISAYYLLLYLPALAIYLASLSEYNSLADIVSNLYNSIFGIATVIAILFVFVHAWIGGRDILIDYMPRARTNFWLNSYFFFLILIALEFAFMVVSLNPYI